MAKEISVPDLRKKLAQLDKKTVDELLISTYKSSQEAQQIINAQLLGDSYGAKLLKDYRYWLHKAFFPNNSSILRSGFSVTKAKGVLSDFKKACKNEAYMVDLQLYYLECCYEFIDKRAIIEEGFYTAMSSIYEQVAKLIFAQKPGILSKKDAHRFAEISNKMKTIDQVKLSKATKADFDIIMKRMFNDLS